MASGIASWRQSLEADGFTRVEGIGDEELCLWPNYQYHQDYYCHFRLTMHCKHNAVSATLPPAPEGDPEHWAYDRTLSLAACVYGSDVQTALAAVGGNSYNPIPSSAVDEHELFFSTNPYWDLVGFENTPCNDGGIFLQGPHEMGPGKVVSVAVNHVDSTICANVRHLMSLALLSGENNPDTISVSPINPINDGGICIFIGGHQRDEWGPSLTTLGWIYQGLPEGFGYGAVSLALYCQYELAADSHIQLPPFHDFGDDNEGIHHGLCTL